MRPFRLWGVLFLVPLLAFLLTVGCSKKDKDTKKGGDDTAAKDDDKDGDKGEQANKGEGEGAGEGEGEGAGEARTVLKAKGWGTLSGTAKFVGDVPERKTIAEAKTHKDHAVCEKGDIKDQTWMVEDKGGQKVVANVVVFLKAPPGKVLPVPDKDKWPKEWTETVKIDQPHCAFVPHVATYWASYYDPKQKKEVPSGQKFEVDNSAPLTHNTRYKGSEFINIGDSLTLQPGSHKPITLKADKNPVKLNCDLHKWMNGYVWSLDNPYAAVSKADGSYKIESVPTGVPVRVVVWHEAKGYLYGPNGKEMTFKEGDNTFDPEVKK